MSMNQFPRLCALLLCAAVQCPLAVEHCLWPFASTASAQVHLWQLPEKDAPYRSNAYEVNVRADGDTAWQRVEVLRCDVDLKKVQQAAFAEFDMEGSVVVRIKTASPLTSQEGVVVRPSSRGIKPRRIDAQTIELTLTRPEYLSVEFGGDRTHNLHLFANPKSPSVSPEGEGSIYAQGSDEGTKVTTPLHNTPLPNRVGAGGEAGGEVGAVINWTAENSQDVFVKDARFIYFGPGVHRPKDLPSEEIKIPSNCTVYLAPGAVVKARLIVDRAENVRIIGRGILDHPLRGIEITYSKHVLVDGLTVLNPAHYTVYGGQSEDITIRHIKSFSARPWSDGIDLMCCRHVRVEDCFLRTSDDCIALYNHRWWYWGGSEDIDVTRCTFWPDVAHPVNIGSHGDDRSDTGETLSGVRIHDCDILYARTNAALYFSCGDKNWVRDVRFHNIRMEGLEQTALFGLTVVFGAKYNRAPGNGVDDVEFSDISFTGDATQLAPSFIRNYDDNHAVGKDIRFRNITINGKAQLFTRDALFQPATP